MCRVPRRTLAHGARALALLLSVGVAIEGRAQTGMVRGRVLDNQGDRPIANAIVDIRDLKRTARSDSGGVFRFDGVPAGAHHVVVRGLGYDSVAMFVRLAARDTIDIDVAMQSTTTRLATVRTEASAGLMHAWKLRAFEERRRTGVGRYLDADFFQQHVGRTVSELLVSRISGLRTRGRGTEHVLVSGRNGRPGCVVQVVLNGISLTNGASPQAFDVNSLHAADILGFEFYTVASTPSQYNASGGREGGSQCGTAVIWTK